MKKISYLFFFLSTICFAQEAGNFEIGLTGGGNISEIQIVTSSNGGSIVEPGFNTGISIEYFLTGSWGVKAKAVYFQKGYSNGYIFYGDNPNDRIETAVRLNYLTVPLMGTFHFRKWYANLGPYVGFLLNAEAKRTNQNVEAAFSSTDAGIAIAVGRWFPLNETVMFTAEIGGQYGFLDAFKDDQDQWVGNNSYFINVGLLFSL